MENYLNCQHQSEKDIDVFAGDYEQRKKKIEKLLDIPDNFDMLNREFDMGGRKTTLYAVDGFLKGEISEKVLEFFYSITEEDMPSTFEEFKAKDIPYVDIIVLKDQEKFIHMLLSGLSCMQWIHLYGSFSQP